MVTSPIIRYNATLGVSNLLGNVFPLGSFVLVLTRRACANSFSFIEIGMHLVPARIYLRWNHGIQIWQKRSDDNTTSSAIQGWYVRLSPVVSCIFSSCTSLWWYVYISHRFFLQHVINEYLGLLQPVIHLPVPRRARTSSHVRGPNVLIVFLRKKRLTTPGKSFYFNIFRDSSPENPAISRRGIARSPV